MLLIPPKPKGNSQRYILQPVETCCLNPPKQREIVKETCCNQLTHVAYSTKTKEMVKDTCCNQLKHVAYSTNTKGNYQIYMLQPVETCCLFHKNWEIVQETFCNQLKHVAYSTKTKEMVKDTCCNQLKHVAYSTNTKGNGQRYMLQPVETCCFFHQNKGKLSKIHFATS